MPSNSDPFRGLADDDSLPAMIPGTVYVAHTDFATFEHAPGLADILVLAGHAVIVLVDNGPWDVRLLYGGFEVRAYRGDQAWMDRVEPDLEVSDGK